MKTLAESIAEHVQTLPVPEQVALIRGLDKTVMPVFASFIEGAHPELVDEFYALVSEREPQLVARFLVWHSDHMPPGVCEDEGCGEPATGQDSMSVADRAVCDRHGEFVDEPWDEAS